MKRHGLECKPDAETVTETPLHAVAAQRNVIVDARVNEHVVAHVILKRRFRAGSPRERGRVIDAASTPTGIQVQVLPKMPIPVDVEIGGPWERRFPIRTLNGAEPEIGSEFKGIGGQRHVNANGILALDMGPAAA